MSAELQPIIELKKLRKEGSLHVTVEYSHDIAYERLIDNQNLFISLTLWDAGNITSTSYKLPVVLTAPVYARYMPFNTLVDLNKNWDYKVLEIENIERVQMITSK